MAVALLFMGLGAAAWVNGASWGKWSVLVGFIGVVIVMYYWFGDAIHVCESGLNSKRIDG
jgi:cytochrome c oxidase subunit 3